MPGPAHPGRCEEINPASLVTKSERSRRWYLRYRERVKRKSREYKSNNLEKCRAANARYYLENRESIIRRDSARKVERRRRDHGFKLLSNLRTRLYLAVRRSRVRKTERTLTLVGCSPQKLLTHLESQFSGGMSWENYGQWHVDHKRPCASFNLSDPEQQRACFHYTNLQPLWEKDNLRKGARL